MALADGDLLGRDGDASGERVRFPVASAGRNVELTKLAFAVGLAETLVRAVALALTGMPAEGLDVALAEAEKLREADAELETEELTTVDSDRVTLLLRVPLTVTVRENVVSALRNTLPDKEADGDGDHENEKVRDPEGDTDTAALRLLLALPLSEAVAAALARPLADAVRDLERDTEPFLDRETEELDDDVGSALVDREFVGKRDGDEERDLEIEPYFEADALPVLLRDAEALREPVFGAPLAE